MHVRGEHGGGGAKRRGKRRLLLGLTFISCLCCPAHLLHRAPASPINTSRRRASISIPSDSANNVLGEAQRALVRALEQGNADRRGGVERERRVLQQRRKRKAAAAQLRHDTGIWRPTPRGSGGEVERKQRRSSAFWWSGGRREAGGRPRRSEAPLGQCAAQLSTARRRDERAERGGGEHGDHVHLRRGAATVASLCFWSQRRGRISARWLRADTINASSSALIPLLPLASRTGSEERFGKGRGGVGSFAFRPSASLSHFLPQMLRERMCVCMCVCAFDGQERRKGETQRAAKGTAGEEKRAGDTPLFIASARSLRKSLAAVVAIVAGVCLCARVCVCVCVCV